MQTTNVNRDCNYFKHTEMNEEDVGSEALFCHEEISSSLKKIKCLADKISEHQNQWLSYFRGRNTNLSDFDVEIKKQYNLLNEKIGKLSAEQLVDLEPIAAVAYGALVEIEKNIYVQRDTNRLQAVQDLQSVINHRLSNSKSLFYLIQFSDISKQFKSFSNPSAQLLISVDGKPSFVPISNVKQEHITAARDYFINLPSVLSDPKLISHMSVEQMIEMEMVICWQFINFLSLMTKSFDYNEAILDTLEEIRAELHKHLAKRDPQQFEGYFKGEKALPYIRLQQYVQKNFYNEKFWDKKCISPLMLSKHRQDLVSYIEMIGHPEKKEHVGMTFINSDEEAGVAVYKNESGEVVILCYGSDTYVDYLNCLQDRDASLGVGGMIHKPVAQRALKAMEALQKMLKEDNLEGQPVVALGFGMNGAVAELMAYKIAKSYPETLSLSFGLGIAPYLDKNSATKMLRQKNFSAVNFFYQEDKNIKVGIFSSLVAKGYSTEQAEIYPVYNPDKFIGDITGHNVQNYLCHIESAVDIPLMMFGMNNQLNAMLTMTQLSSEEQGESLQKMYTQIALNSGF